MYWLLSVLILTVMMAALAIADRTMLPNHLLWISLNTSIGLWLIVIAVVFMGVVKRRSIADCAVTSRHSSFGFLRRFPHYFFTILLAFALIIGSALQALSSHQHAETTKITDAMRVQALVTIEGISDSVYDGATDSGYRQVATLDYLSPLITALTTEDLAVMSIAQVIEQSAIYEAQKNSLSDVEFKDTPTKPIKHRILLHAYPKTGKKKDNLASLNDLQPNEQRLMTLTLAPLASTEDKMENPTGFDSYRWLRGRHLDGNATILAVGAPLNHSATVRTSASYFQRFRSYIDTGRWRLRQHFYQDWSSQTLAQQQASAVTLSLLTGDRSLINRDTKDLYQLAGISHLLAISGTHVLFLAIMMAGAAVWLFDTCTPALYRYVPRWQMRWGVMIGAAFIYALFTGFDVPAARTAWMLLAVGVVRLSLLPISTMRVLVALAIVMAWVDPYVLWQAGYWLSFIAVALLLKYDDGVYRQQKNNHQRHHFQQRKDADSQKCPLFYGKLWELFKNVFKLQCWLFIALLPITLLLFGKASLWGLLINLFAIGLFGWVIVPLNLLAGLFYLFIPSFADSLWAMVRAIVAGLHELITWLTAVPTLQGAWLYTAMNTAILLMALLVMLPWLLPRGLLSRWLALPPLTLLAMTLYSNQQALSLSPTLYILPTGDKNISAAVLHYPITSPANAAQKNSADKENWLFLADHRPQGQRMLPSSLSADTLSAQIEQQLRTLSIKHLQGVVVQTNSLLLSSTVLQLAPRLPTNQYWQAGNPQPIVTDTAIISAQGCHQGKMWQSAHDALTLQALTGWSEIKDASVWDCSVAIDSTVPIKVVRYNAANPLQPLPLKNQIITTSTITTDNTVPIASQNTLPDAQAKSRLILDAATHSHLWQLWSLLCQTDASILARYDPSTTWLGHSASRVSSDALQSQQVKTVLTYDAHSLNAAQTLSQNSDNP